MVIWQTTWCRLRGPSFGLSRTSRSSIHFHDPLIELRSSLTYWNPIKFIQLLRHSVPITDYGMACISLCQFNDKISRWRSGSSHPGVWTRMSLVWILPSSITCPLGSLELVTFPIKKNWAHWSLWRNIISSVRWQTERRNRTVGTWISVAVSDWQQ